MPIHINSIQKQELAVRVNAIILELNKEIKKANDLRLDVKIIQLGQYGINNSMVTCHISETLTYL